MTHQPVERDIVIEGEVEEIDDSTRTFLLRAGQSRLEVPFLPHQRTTVFEAIRDRPIARVSVRGRLVPGPPQRMKTVEDLELVDHERAADVLKLWARVSQLAETPRGWLRGDGEPPSEQARAQAREVLARLLVDHRDIERPKLYPTPDGGIQAEWVIGDWAAEAKFSASADFVALEATNGATGEDRALDVPAAQLSADNAGPMATWLVSLALAEVRHV